MPAFGERPVANIAVDLQDALEPSQMGGWPLGLAIGRIYKAPLRAPPPLVMPWRTRRQIP